MAVAHAVKKLEKITELIGKTPTARLLLLLFSFFFSCLFIDVFSAIREFYQSSVWYYELVWN